MKFERLKNLFKRNKKEINEIDNNEKLSIDVKEDRKKILSKQNEVINKYNDVYTTNNEKIEKNLEEIHDASDNNKILLNNEIIELQKEMKEQELNVKREMQGKKKNIISAYFGQIDKRINNYLFKKSKLGTFLWNNYSNLVNNRYNDLNKYLTINIGVILILVGLGVFTSLPSFLTIGLGSLVGGVTTVNTISTLYNKEKFGGPLLKRFKTIFKGNRKEVIETSKYAYEKARILTDDGIEIENIDEIREFIEMPKEEETFEEEIAKDKEEVEVNTRKQDNEDNLEPYHLEENDEDMNVQKDNEVPQKDFLKENISLGIQLSDNDLSYLQAYSKIRKSNDNNDRIDAYSKLATTYGKNTKKKKDTDIEKLNYYSRRLKALSEYGRKIHEGTASKEEQELYLALLYNLGKDFNEDDVMDYLSDVYEAEKQKSLRKVS